MACRRGGSCLLRDGQHCLKKTPTAQSPLEHRPIALRNTDYKIYTRIFALRLRPYLSSLVHPYQAGFVPNRSIHTTVDTLLAVQRQARAAGSGTTGVCALLDFAKAYDYFNRTFLTEMLRRRGFHPSFVTLVATIHENTAGRFLVNGFLSSPLQIAGGIRQGCPLAPFLFLIAIDTLYHRIDEHSEIRGVTIRNGEGEYEFRIAGYADDTALLLRDDAQLPIAMSTLEVFSTTSWLRVNKGKSVLMPLGELSNQQPREVAGTPVLDRDKTCRYLGVQVGAGSTEPVNWATALASFRFRLRFAISKTHTLL